MSQGGQVSFEPHVQPTYKIYFLLHVSIVDIGNYVLLAPDER